MTIFILRGAHANEYELQNYYPIAVKHDIRVITTHRVLTPISLPTIKLWSPADLPNFPFKKQIFNRLIGGGEWLVGLEELLRNKSYHVSKHGNNKVIVHSAETYTPYTHQAVQLRKQGLIDKLVCTCWETIPHNNEKFARLKRWKKEAYRYVDIFHTPTHRAKDALIKEGVDPKKIMVIPYGVNLKKFSFRECKLPKKPIILTVARRVSEKGYDLWLQVKEQLGDRAELHWVDKIEYKDMPKIYRSSDLFFLPSLSTPTWEEQYGMALVEAMASGLPIITTNSGAIPEVVGKVTILVKPGNVNLFVEAINKLIASPSLYQRMSAKSVAQAHKLTKASAQLIELYIID